MKTKAEPIASGFSAWTVRALWISLRDFGERDRLDCHTDGRQMAAAGGRGGARVGSVTARLTAAPEHEELGLRVHFIEAGNAAGPNVARYLWLVRWSGDQGRGVFWETAAFVVTWLSGLIGVALCLM